jgi:hypothetical protein
MEIFLNYILKNTIIIKKNNEMENRNCYIQNDTYRDTIILGIVHMIYNLG